MQVNLSGTDDKACDNYTKYIIGILINLVFFSLIGLSMLLLLQSSLLCISYSFTIIVILSYNARKCTYLFVKHTFIILAASENPFVLFFADSGPVNIISNLVVSAIDNSYFCANPNKPNIGMTKSLRMPHADLKL